MTTARSGLAYLLVALLAWTSIAAGIFVPTSSAHQATSAIHPPIASHQSGDADQRGKIHAISAHGAEVMELAATPTGASPAGTTPESMCVASCLDTIAAKLAPPPHETAAPDDSDGTVISWPLHALTHTPLPHTDYRPWPTGPPDPVQWERSGAARLVLANARLRI